MTVTPISATSGPRQDDYLSNGPHSIPSQTYNPRSAPPGHPSSLPAPRPSFQQPTRAATSPSVQTPNAGMRPPMTSGPSSHTGHSSSTPMASSAYNGYQQKSHSAHGHGSNNSQQPSYFGPGPSGVQIPATYGAPGTFGRGAGSSRGGAGGRMEDDDMPLNSPNPPFANASGSRPSSPRSNNSHSDDTHPSSRYYNNITSSSSPQSQGQSYTTSSTSINGSPSNINSAWASTTTVTTPAATAYCSACQQPMSGQFVRALGTVFHLDCFRCGDCNTVVASKFFPIEGSDGKQQPLCERDYFRRLNLICAKCEQALRGSYITACNKKFHVEHFACSVCPTLFGPQDSYYEHNGDVYCHFHYSTRFATKCVGCGSAILKQFVEINRNLKEECWHPECYMIHKFWNVKVASRPTSSLAYLDSEAYTQEEAEYNATTLKEKQLQMETLVNRIWTHLSAFEESSAACISDMLRHVSNGMYLDAIRMAEKFILHVEVLFAVIDELEAGFARAGAKGMSHVREARMLCRKTVDLFTLLSHTQDSSSSTNPSQVQSQRMGMTQDLLALVTGLAHYLKILIRIALTGALKLEREHSNGDALLKFLDRLQCLGMDGADPNAKRQQHVVPARIANISGASEAGPPSPLSLAKLSGSTAVDYSEGVTYGYRSLGPDCAGESPFSPKAIAQAIQKGASSVLTPPSDLCAACKLTVEEDCVRLGTYQRWHSHCVKCVTCGKVAAVAPVKGDEKAAAAAAEANANGTSSENKKPSKVSSARRPPANVDEFRYEQLAVEPSSSSDKIPQPKVVIYCTAHATSDCRSGFSAVSRLEQYAFLLNVALRRLYLLLHKRGVMHLTASSTPSPTSDSPTNSYRDSAEILRMKSSVHLDRKLSATARMPKRSTIIESPTGKIAQPTGGLSHHPQVSGPDPSALSQRSVQPSNYPVSSQQSNYPGSSRGPVPLQAKGGQPPPRPPPPNIPPLNQYEPYPQPAPQGPYGGPVSPLAVSPGQEAHAIRPTFARNNTQVLVVDDKVPDPYEHQSQSSHYDVVAVRTAQLTQAPETESPKELAGGFQDDDGITLADIPQLLESEQAKEQRRSLPRMAGKPLLAELTPLELVIIKNFAVLALQRSPLKDQFEIDDILELIEVKKSTFWNRLFKAGDKKNVKKKGVFGVPLELLAEQGTDSMLGSSRAPLRVPIFIDDVISAMKQMDMSIEGIFRKNGNIRRLKELTEALDRDATSVDLSQENPVQLAALVKKFFRELPDPLMTFKLHKLWNAVASIPVEEDRKRTLHMLCVILPKSHRDTLEALFVFLKWVASFSHVDEETGSKMDLQNLATVICPSILYAKGREASREDSFTAIPVVTELLEGQDEFYAVPDEFIPILQDQEYFANCLDMPCKDVLKKADTYLRLKSSGRSPMPGQNGASMQTSGSAAGHGGNGRGDGAESRLAPRRSDPAMSRGRSPNGPMAADGFRSPPPLRLPNASRSKERKQSDPRVPTHPGMSHPALTSPGPPSPRQQQRMEQPWAGNQPNTPYGAQGGWQGGQPGSRPASWARPNGEYFPPPQNGRQSPANRF
ncbi:hypothetical protein FRC01_000915 [Tulasnella sp. 417]|nr:hypothetical protein FRC01_000915 [Tulasnella sp. 417]